MIDLSRFQNNFTITIQGGYKTIAAWDEVDGYDEEYYVQRLDYLNDQFFIEEYDFHNIGMKILDSLKKNIKNIACLKWDDLQIYDNRLSFSFLEDAHGYAIGDKETSEQIYLNDYDVFISINGIELSKKELRALFYRVEPEINK